MELPRGRIVQYLSAFCISIATMTLGAASSWTSPVIAKFDENQTDFHMTSTDISWLVSLNNPGFIIGSLPTGYFVDRYGRRTVIIASAVPYLLGTINLIFARTGWLVCLTRFIWGWATGMVSIVVGMYVAEIADKEIRGRLSVITKFMTNLGGLIPMAIGPLISYNTLNYILLVFPLTYFFLCWWIPESPYYHLRRGRVGAARKELCRLRKYKDEKEFEDDLGTMQSQVKNEMRRSGTLKELFRSKRYRKAIIIAVGLKMTQIMTGTVTVKQYLGPIIKQSNIKLQTSNVLLIYGVLEFVTSIITSLMADSFGRRHLLIFSYFGTSLYLGMTGVYFFFQEVIGVDMETLRTYSVIPFFGIIHANIISALGFASIIFAIIGEIFPMNVKSSAMTCLNILGGISGFLVAKFFKSIYDISGYCGLFWIFSAVSLTGSVFSLLFVPETKGKSLREIQIQLQGDLYEEANENLNKKTANDELVNVELEECQELNTLERKENTNL